MTQDRRNGPPVNPTIEERIRFAAASVLVKAAIVVVPDRYHERIDIRILQAAAAQKGLTLAHDPERENEDRRYD